MFFKYLNKDSKKSDSFIQKNLLMILHIPNSGNWYHRKLSNEFIHELFHFSVNVSNK
jgi:hypothetical protein